MRLIRGLSLSSVVLCTVVICSCGGGNPVAPPPPPVNDPPKITCPAPVTVTSASAQPISVAFGTPTTTAGAPPVTTKCTYESGASFPVGTTTVSCTATDSLQRSDTCSFQVTVLRPPQIGLTRFVAFGDSITWGENGQATLTSTSLDTQIYPRVQYPFNQTYPGALQLLLQTRYTLQSPTVQNQGNPGEEVSDPATVSRFTSVIAGGSFQSVLLMEGANDVADQLANGGNTAAGNAVIDRAIANLRTMLHDAQSRAMRPYLATIPPENPNGTPRRGGGANFVPPFNDRVRTLASAEGVTLVDVYAAIAGQAGWESTLIGPDGLHPTAAGYALIAQTFFTTLKSTLETAPTTTSLFSAPAPASPPARTGSFGRPAAAGPGSRPVTRRPR